MLFRSNARVTMLPLRYRLLLVIGGAAACALVPAPSAEQGRPAIAVAAVRQWLLSASAGAPLRRATHAGELPPLLVEFTNSPPLPEDARARAEQEIAAVAKEWAAARAARGEDVRFAPAAPAVPVRVMVGDAGVRATLQADQGSTAYEHLFWRRSTLRPICGGLLLVHLASWRPLLQVLALGGAAAILALMRYAV